MRKSRIEVILNHTLREISRAGYEITQDVDIGLENKYQYKCQLGMSQGGGVSLIDLKLTEHEIAEITKAVESHLKQLKL